MDKSFEDIIGETLNDLSDNNQPVSNVDSSSESTPEPENEPQETVVDSASAEPENQELDDSQNADDDSLNDFEDLGDIEEAPSTYQKDAEAFARMRTELKQTNNDLKNAENVINFFDIRAKQMGLNGVQELMQKTVESEMAKQAEKTGIPVDVLKRINDLETKVKQQDIERENLQRTQKEQSLNYILDSFMQNHSLGQNDVVKLANDLVADGFNFDALMNMPSSAVTKILNSYLPNESLKQEALAKKEQIKKEVPPTGSSSSNVNQLESEIDKIAKSWSNSY